MVDPRRWRSRLERWPASGRFGVRMAAVTDPKTGNDSSIAKRSAIGVSIGQFSTTDYKTIFHTRPKKLTYYGELAWSTPF